MSGVIGVGYTASINNSDYLLEEDKSNNMIQITARNYGTSGLCVLTQNESGNKINLKITTPPEEKEYWEIRFTPKLNLGVNMDDFFKISTNISGEDGSMADGTQYKNWIVNQNRNMINVYISPVYPGNDLDILSCLTYCLGPALIRMVMLLALTTIYRVIHTLQQKQSDWVPMLLRKFQLLLPVVKVP